VRPVSARIRARISSAIKVAITIPFKSGHVEIGLVERQRFDVRRIVREYCPDPVRDFAIGIEPRLYEDQIGAAAKRGYRRHRRADAEAPRFVARRGDDSPSHSADRDRFASKLRIVALLDRRVEGIHVDMDDLAQGLGWRRLVHPVFLARATPVRQRGKPRRRQVSASASPRSAG